MNILRFLWMGGVLGLLLIVLVTLPSSNADASPDPGKVTFKSPHTSYEFEVGHDAAVSAPLQAEESRRISIAIRPAAAASENTDVQVKVKKTIITSSEDHDTDSRSNEVSVDKQLSEEEEEEFEREKRKRDCRGLPWPFVNAVNASNCLDLDSEEFTARLIGKAISNEDEEDATVVLPKRKKKRRPKKGRRNMDREEDFVEDYPVDPFHSSLPQARTYHEYAMMLRDMAVPDMGVPPHLRGPVTYQDYYNKMYKSPYEEQGSHSHNGWGWGWSTTTTPPPNNGWGQPQTTTQPGNQRQGHELKPSFGQPSQPGNGGSQSQPASFGQPSNPQPGPQGKQLSFGQPAPQQQTQPGSFGQPSQSQNSSRQGKAISFGQPSQQQTQPQQQQQFQQRQGYLAPGYYPPTTSRPNYGRSEQSNGWGETTTQSSGWDSTTQNNGWSESTTQSNNGWTTTTTTTTTPPPDYRRPPYQPLNQLTPAVYPLNKGNPQPTPQQQPSNPANVTELYNRLLNLYKLLINDTSGQQPTQTSPPVYQQPNPWQVPPPRQPSPWGGSFGGNRQFDGYYPAEILPGIRETDPYMYDPIDQPKLLPRPISPVGRRGRQFRRRNSRIEESEERGRGPRVSFMNEEPKEMREIDNQETFLPRRRYFKRKIDDNDFKSVSDKKMKRKKEGKRRWGTTSRDDDLDDYYRDPALTMGYNHPDIPPWLRSFDDSRAYQPPPVYGPPPPESGGGWGGPTQPPPQNGWTESTTQGWGWPESTTQQMGWGSESTTTTTEKPGWGWENESSSSSSSSTTTSTTTTSTTTTESPPPEENQETEQEQEQQQEEQQQPDNSTMTEQGPPSGPPDWSVNNQDNRAALQQQLVQLQQQLLQQLQSNGQLPPEYQKELQQQQQQYQQQQQQRQPPTQYPILQPNFASNQGQAQFQQQNQQPQSQTGQQFPVQQPNQGQQLQSQTNSPQQPMTQPGQPFPVLQPNQFQVQQQQQYPVLQPNNFGNNGQQFSPVQNGQQRQPVPQFPILQPNFGSSGQFSPQQVQQPPPVAQQIQQTTTGTSTPILDPQVIVDIGRDDITDNRRVAAARQLFNEPEEVGRSVVETVTSKSVVESVGEQTEEVSTPAEVDKSGGDEASPAEDIQRGQVEQVSSNTTSPSSPLGQNVYSPASIPAARQLRYSESTPGGTASIQPRRAPSWGTWGGSYSQTYSKVQNSQPSYRIMKRLNEGQGLAMGRVETDMGIARKVDDASENEDNRPSLIKRIID